MSNENQYLKERKALIQMLSEEITLLWHDYQNITDNICRIKVKTIFDKKESQLYKVLQEREKWQLEKP